MKPIKIVIADDHQLVVDGLVSILSAETDIDILGTANNGIEAFEIIEKTSPDIALVDIEMPDINGIELTSQLANSGQTVKIIAISMYNETSLITKIVSSGARGYILKNVVKSELLEAIRTVAAGNRYLSPAIFDPTGTQIKGYLEREAIPDIGLLTKREKEILIFISEGLAIREIADKLCVSHRTIDTHRTNIMKKLEVNSTSGLVRAAYKSGLCR